VAWEWLEGDGKFVRRPVPLRLRLRLLRRKSGLRQQGLIATQAEIWAAQQVQGMRQMVEGWRKIEKR